MYELSRFESDLRRDLEQRFLPFLGRVVKPSSIRHPRGEIIPLKFIVKGSYTVSRVSIQVRVNQYPRLLFYILDPTEELISVVVELHLVSKSGRYKHIENLNLKYAFDCLDKLEDKRS